ncbi:MAG: hypothetical protein OEU26_25515, partial [Candidatus Tectomicrobia bacterium]|nr:hypothetical protein [Candidatus Tectomicrobia bacterium]
MLQYPTTYPDQTASWPLHKDSVILYNRIDARVRAIVMSFTVACRKGERQMVAVTSWVVHLAPLT